MGDGPVESLSRVCGSEVLNCKRVLQAKPIRQPIPTRAVRRDFNIAQMPSRAREGHAECPIVVSSSLYEFHQSLNAQSSDRTEDLAICGGNPNIIISFIRRIRGADAHGGIGRSRDSGVISQDASILEPLKLR